MGKFYYGNHEDVMAAAEIANEGARNHARKKGTCYEPAKVSECKRGDDGKYTCRAHAANHGGSCPMGLMSNEEDPVVDRLLDNPEDPDEDA